MQTIDNHPCVFYRMPMDTKQSNTANLATAFARDERWAAWVLGGLGVSIGADGTFDAQAAGQALERALHRLSATNTMTIPDWAASAEMGVDEEACRRWFVAQLERVGVQVTGRGLRRALRMTLRVPGGREVRVLTYVALATKSSGQLGFTVSYLDDESIDWIVFIAKPFGRVYLRRRREVIERLKAKEGVAKTATVTFSQGGSDADLMEYRIEELVRGTP